MDFFLHIVVSTALGTQLNKNPNAQRAFILGGLVPDLDVIFVWIPFLMPELFIFQHRGLFHTVFLAPIIVSLLIVLINYLNKVNVIQRLKEPLQAFSIDINSRTVLWGTFGVFIHLLMDVISYNGVFLFYPLINHRIAFNLVSVIDPFASVLSIIIVIRLFFNKIVKIGTYSIKQFQRSATMISILFVVLLSTYAILQLNTTITHSPDNTKPEFIPIFRWLYSKDQNDITISLVNQLTQKIVVSYSYPSLIYNQTAWNIKTIESVIDQAKVTTKYQRYIYQLDSESYLSINATLNTKEFRWQISFLNTFQDAQYRFFGLSRESSPKPSLMIYLNQDRISRIK